MKLIKNHKRKLNWGIIFLGTIWTC